MTVPPPALRVRTKGPLPARVFARGNAGDEVVGGVFEDDSVFLTIFLLLFAVPAQRNAAPRPFGRVKDSRITEKLS